MCLCHYPLVSRQSLARRQQSYRPSMCIVERVATMFGRASSCRHIPGDTYSTFDDDSEPPPLSPPKLTRCHSTPHTATLTLSRTPEHSLPPSENLKPNVFRRKQPALHFLACVRGDVLELAGWLFGGGDPNERDSEGWALLQHASVSLTRVMFICRCTWLYSRVARRAAAMAVLVP